MSKTEKLLKRLLSKPKDFTWSEAVTLLNHFGFEVIPGAGSRRKFKHSKTKSLIILHEPHPGTILKTYTVQEIIKTLTEGGFLK